MSAPNLELVPLDRRAGHALITAARCRLGDASSQCASSSQAAAAWQALMAPAGRDERGGCGRWADVPPVWNRPPCQATAAQPDSTLAHRHHCTAGGPSGAAWPWWKGRRYVRSCRGAARGWARCAPARPAAPCPLALVLPFSGSLCGTTGTAHAPARRSRRHCFCIDMRSLSL